jgi:hypothetical protein
MPELIATPGDFCHGGADTGSAPPSDAPGFLIQRSTCAVRRGRQLPRSSRQIPGNSACARVKLQGSAQLLRNVYTLDRVQGRGRGEPMPPTAIVDGPVKAASICGVSNAAIHKWINRRNMYRKHALSLTRACGIPNEELVGPDQAFRPKALSLRIFILNEFDHEEVAWMRTALELNVHSFPDNLDYQLAGKRNARNWLV